MEDLKRIGNITINLILYGCWVGLIYQISLLIGLFEWEDSTFTIICYVISFILQWVGGIFFVSYLRKFF